MFLPRHVRAPAPNLSGLSVIRQPVDNVCVDLQPGSSSLSTSTSPHPPQAIVLACYVSVVDETAFDCGDDVVDVAFLTHHPEGVGEGYGGYYIEGVPLWNRAVS